MFHVQVYIMHFCKKWHRNDFMSSVHHLLRCFVISDTIKCPQLIFFLAKLYLVFLENAIFRNQNLDVRHDHLYLVIFLQNTLMGQNQERYIYISKPIYVKSSNNINNSRVYIHTFNLHLKLQGPSLPSPLPCLYVLSMAVRQLALIPTV